MSANAIRLCYPEIATSKLQCSSPGCQGRQFMSAEGKSRIPQVLKQHEAEILAEWTKELTSTTSTSPSGRLDEKELHEHCRGFLRLVQEASQHGNITDTTAAEWQGARELLSEISRSRALKGFNPSDTA